jgi:serine O-acetyltransferase
MSMLNREVAPEGEGHDQRLEQLFRSVADDLLGKACSESERCRMPSPYVIKDLIAKFTHLLFPRSHYEIVETESSLRDSVPRTLAKVYESLSHEIHWAFNVVNQEEEDRRQAKAQEVTLALLSELSSIRKVLECDLEEVMNHDPAATGIEEVLLAYPGFEALTVHRLAHFLHLQGIPLIPRMMSEMVHSRTGIDIHPGAQIAPYCSIDHGTGLIIGETTVIGEHVNLFHNVTLGARKVTPEFRGCRRHPTIGRDVIIYPGATILGDITVGENTVIGGNVFLLESCPPDSKIYAEPPKMILKKKGGGSAKA